MITAVIVCAVLILAWLAGYLILTRTSATQPYRPRHHGRGPFADPADRSDPDGAGYVGQLLEPPAAEPPWLDEDELDAGWWAQCAPPPGIEILTAPARIARTEQLTTAVLERVRAGLLGVEPDGTSATFAPAPGITMPVSDDPDTTGVQPVAVRTWGMSAPEKAAELAARYLT